MSLVGDMIFRTRSKIPDLPPTLPAPTGAFAVVTATGSTLPSGVYFGVVTQRNSWGETLPSNEFTFTIGANQGVQITSALLPGAVAIRLYLTLVGGTAGSEIQFIESAVSPFVVSVPLTGFGGPPSRSTAYLMDSDGPQFGASTLYDWLNEGLNKISSAVGGLQDYCGVPTVAGQPLYNMPGEWLEVSDVWYAGYWIQGGQRGQFYRRNAVTSQVLSNVAISVFTDKQIIEVSYQPDRTSGVTATTAAMGSTDTSVAIGNTGVFLLPFGFAQIGNEIVSYSSLNGGVIGGLIRGLGASVAQAWPTNTTVTELSLFWCGKRIFADDTYSPGQASTSLAVPEGWTSIIPMYMLAQAKKAELDLQAAQALEEECFKQAEKWIYANRGVVRQVQVGGYGMQTNVGTFNSTVAGGIIIPGI